MLSCLAKTCCPVTLGDLLVDLVFGIDFPVLSRYVRLQARYVYRISIGERVAR